MSGENVEVVKAMFAAFNSGDPTRSLEFIDPEVRWEDPTGIPGGGVHHGHEGLEQWFIRWLSAWEGFRSDLEKYVDEGDQVIVVERHHGRGRQSGVKVERTVVSGYRVRDGKVVQRVDFTTDAEMRARVGLKGP